MSTDPGGENPPGSPKPEPKDQPPKQSSSSPPASSSQPSRYESQKRRDWNTFLQYLKNHKPPLSLLRCSGAHIIEFLNYLDQFGKTKVHDNPCPHYGKATPPASCPCPLKQAWGSLDALIGRLRAAYEENGGKPETNPFAKKPVRIYLREVKESQAKARGIPYEKKKRKRSQLTTSTSTSTSTYSSSAAAETVTVAVVGDVNKDEQAKTGGGERSSAPAPEEEGGHQTPPAAATDS